MSDELFQKIRLLGNQVLNSREHINRFQAGVIMLSLSYGSSVVVLPYTVKELGIYMWLFLMLLIFILSWYSTQLINHASVDMHDEVDISEIKDPYPDLAEFCWGKNFKKIVTVTLYLSHSAMSIGWILMASSLLADVFEIENVSRTNKIRLWSVVVVVVSSPFMFIGLYKDLVSTAYMAVSTSAIASIGVLLNLTIAKATVELNIGNKTADEGSIRSLFRNYGILAFATSGSSYILPNLTGALPLDVSIVRTISYTYLLIIFIYLCLGVVPFVLLGQLIAPSIAETFTNIMRVYNLGVPFHIILVIIQLTMSFHSVFVSVLVMHPVFRNAEKYLKIPKDWSWQRIIVRSAILLIILIVCFLLPRFDTVLSIVGGVPLTFLAFTFPIIIHMKTFRLNNFHWIFGISLIVFCMIMQIGNLYVSIEDMINIYKQQGFLGSKIKIQKN